MPYKFITETNTGCSEVEMATTLEVSEGFDDMQRLLDEWGGWQKAAMAADRPDFLIGFDYRNGPSFCRVVAVNA